MSEDTPPLSQRILDGALDLAERCDWEAVRLHTVARQMGISLDDVRRCYREKEELVDAWFDRADSAMLRAADAEGFAALDSGARIHGLLMAWLESLAPHRRVTRQMILGKLEPGHLHYQLGGLLRISRTVQWLREAGGRTATLPWRALEETSLSALYLAAFLRWLYDDSPGSRATSRFLESSLALWGKCEKVGKGRVPRTTQAATGEATAGLAD